ncbi:hypothetical protein C8R44DRAFT_791655 [Mycena epipterygia]|nr:hypothetical protein C8R44DRAFT_791655 [Mycena epipterygia]
MLNTFGQYLNLFTTGGVFISHISLERGATGVLVLITASLLQAIVGPGMGTVVKGRVTKKGSPVGLSVHKTLLADLVRVQISVSPSCTSTKEVGLMVAVTVSRTSSARAYVIVVPATPLPMMPALKMAFLGPRPRGTATVKICVAAACVLVAAGLPTARRAREVTTKTLENILK